MLPHILHLWVVRRSRLGCLSAVREKALIKTHINGIIRGPRIPSLLPSECMNLTSAFVESCFATISGREDALTSTCSDICFHYFHPWRELTRWPFPCDFIRVARKLFSLRTFITAPSYGHSTKRKYRFPTVSYGILCKQKSSIKSLHCSVCKLATVDLSWLWLSKWSL